MSVKKSFQKKWAKTRAILSRKFARLVSGEKLFTDLMEEQRKLWITDPTYNEWDGASKLLIKQRVKELGCRVPETYFFCDSADELDFSKLPDQCVIKPSHLGGGKGVFMLRDGIELFTGKQLDEEVVRGRLRDCLEQRQKGWHRAPYADIKPHIIVEELIPNEFGKFDLHIDYKVAVFHGRACLIRIALGEPYYHDESNSVNPDIFADYYTRDWKLIDYDEITYHNWRPRRYDHSRQAPENLSQLVEWSERIAKASNKDFMRVDFFRTPNEFVLGECTLRPGSYRSKITPFANAYMGWLWQNPDLLDSAFDPEAIRNSRLSRLCKPGFNTINT